MGASRVSVLVVEDDAVTAAALVRGLRAAGFEVELATDGAQAVTHILGGSRDVVLLDLMLPERSGFDVLERVQHVCRAPIIVLTARTELEDRLRAFALGARDFVCKPFWMEEVVARIRSHTCAPALATNRVLTAGSIRVDLDARCATVDGEAATLTPTELSILVYLLKRPGRAVSRRTLGEQALTTLEERDERTVDSHVARLRKKLGAHAACLGTVWGIGYRFDPPTAEGG